MKHIIARCAAILLFLINGVYCQEHAIINDIEAYDNFGERVNYNFVESIIEPYKGEILNKRKISNDIKKMYRSGYFSNIEAKFINANDIGKLVFIFTYKVKLDEIMLVGTSIENSSILKKLKLDQEGYVCASSIYDIKNIIKSIYDKNNNFSCNTIDFKYTKINDPKFKLVVSIEEEVNHKISKIIFNYNSKYNDSTIKELLSIEEGDYWSNTLVNNSASKITSWYNKNGYYDTIVSVNQKLRSDQSYELEFRIFEGDCYILDRVRINGNQSYSSKQLLKHFKGIGEVYSKTSVENFEEVLKKLYFKIGYYDADIQKEIFHNIETGRIRIDYKIKEGNKHELYDFFVDKLSKINDFEYKKNNKKNNKKTLLEENILLPSLILGIAFLLLLYTLVSLRQKIKQSHLRPQKRNPLDIVKNDPKAYSQNIIGEGNVQIAGNFNIYLQCVNFMKILPLASLLYITYLTLPFQKSSIILNCSLLILLISSYLLKIKKLLIFQLIINLMALFIYILHPLFLHKNGYVIVDEHELEQSAGFDYESNIIIVHSFQYKLYNYLFNSVFKKIDVENYGNKYYLIPPIENAIRFNEDSPTNSAIKTTIIPYIFIDRDISLSNERLSIGKGLSSSCLFKETYIRNESTAPWEAIEYNGDKKTLKYFTEINKFYNNTIVDFKLDRSLREIRDLFELTSSHNEKIRLEFIRLDFLSKVFSGDIYKLNVLPIAHTAYSLLFREGKKENLSAVIHLYSAEILNRIYRDFPLSFQNKKDEITKYLSRHSKLLKSDPSKFISALDNISKAPSVDKYKKYFDLFTNDTTRGGEIMSYFDQLDSSKIAENILNLDDNSRRFIIRYYLPRRFFTEFSSMFFSYADKNYDIVIKKYQNIESINKLMNEYCVPNYSQFSKYMMMLMGHQINPQNFKFIVRSSLGLNEPSILNSFSEYDWWEHQYFENLSLFCIEQLKDNIEPNFTHLNLYDKRGNIPPGLIYIIYVILNNSNIGIPENLKEIFYEKTHITILEYAKNIKTYESNSKGTEYLQGLY